MTGGLCDFCCCDRVAVGRPEHGKARHAKHHPTAVILTAPARSLYAMYLDPVVHAEISGAPVTIGTTPGAPFRAFDGSLTGHMLTVVEPRLIIQSWRSVHFSDNDPDSTLIMTFTAEGTSGRIDLVHLDVPSHDYLGVTNGWETHYWTPWRRYQARG